MTALVPGIYGFQGEHRFLSNFFPSEVIYLGMLYPTVENAYQAAKTEDRTSRIRLTYLTAGQAKTIGKSLQLRPDWEDIKEQVMLELLRQKFQHKKLQQALLDTGELYLEETNHWKDQYWGVCNGKGLNRLGHLLMQVRQELNERICNV